MLKNTKQNFLVALKITLVGVSLPLFFTSSSWAQACNQNAIDGVIEKLKIDSESSSAMETLRQCGSLAVPQLKDALKNQDQRVRRGAAMILGEVGLSARVAVSDLTKVLQDTDLEVRLEAVKAILKIDSDRQAAVLAVIEISKFYDAEENSIAFYAINQEISPSTVDALIKLLKDKNQPEPLRLYALNAVRFLNLQRITNKPPAKPAVTVLLNILNDKNESDSIRSKAISALRQFGSEDKAIITAFIKVLKNATEPPVRRQAAEALTIVSETPEAKVAVPVLIQVFKDKGEPSQVRNGAVNALSHILHLPNLPPRNLFLGSKHKFAISLLNIYSSPF